MFYKPPVAPWRIPESMEPKFNFVMIATFVSLGVMFFGMFSASAYQSWYGIKATTLLEAPLLLQGMMVGGFLSFLTMLISFVGLITWCDVKEYFLNQPC